jgi:hypothetical protein
MERTQGNKSVLSEGDKDCVKADNVSCLTCSDTCRMLKKGNRFSLGGHNTNFVECVSVSR